MTGCAIYWYMDGRAAGMGGKSQELGIRMLSLRCKGHIKRTRKVGDKQNVKTDTAGQRKKKFPGQYQKIGLAYLRKNQESEMTRYL